MYRQHSLSTFFPSVDAQGGRQVKLLKLILSWWMRVHEDQWLKLSYLLFQHLIELLWISGSSHPFIICHSWCQTSNFHGKSGKKCYAGELKEMSQYFLIGKTIILLFCITVPTASVITFRLWKLYLPYIKVIKSQQTLVLSPKEVKY